MLIKVCLIAKMNEPMVSVVIPIYNTEKYLGECLDSICNQTLRDIEIICVDDGSTDNSLEIAEKFRKVDRRLTILKRRVSSGSGAVPRNEGLRHAKGKYVIFLDSDDYFDKNMLKIMEEDAENNNADLVMCSNYRVDDNGKIIDADTVVHFDCLPEYKVFSYGDIPDRIFQITNAAAWHKLYKKEIIDNHGLLFQENVPILDDIFFVNASLIASKRISAIRDRLVFYRECRPGAQTQNIQDHFDSIFLAFGKLVLWLKTKRLYYQIENSLKNWILSTMSWWYECIDDKDVSRKVFDLYKNEYFKVFNLSGMELSDIEYKNRGFFSYIMLDRYHPSPQVVVKSMLSPNTKIIIYGAGRRGKKIRKIIDESTKHHIVAWCDQQYEKYKELGVVSPQTIKEKDYDAVLICIADVTVANMVKRNLIQLGVEEKKIYL